jgi:hypothetical protein
LPRAILRADGLFDYGVLPGAGFGVALTAGVALDPWRFEAVGSFWTPRAATLPGEPQVGGRFVLGAVTLRGCGVPRARALEFPICLGFETGAMRARGFGVEDPTVSHRLWAAGQLGAGLAWAPTPRLALRFEAQVVVAAARPAFQIVDAGLIHRAAPAAPRAAVGLEVRLP